jgi:hypothetical protein
MEKPGRVRHAQRPSARRRGLMFAAWSLTRR